MSFLFLSGQEAAVMMAARIKEGRFAGLFLKIVARKNVKV